MPNPDPLFDAWWEKAKNTSEARGCSMPFAFAAWLAGKEQNGSTEVFVTQSVPENTEVRLHAVPVSDGRKVEGKQGRYRGDKLKGAAEKIKQLENPDGKEK
jgi:hypothetical protein